MRENRWQMADDRGPRIADHGLQTATEEDAGQKNEDGFTLIEVLLVVVIIGILSLGVVMGVAKRSRQASENTTRFSIGSTMSAVSAFEIDNGTWPSTLSELVTDTGHPSWSGPYIRSGKIPSDAWGTVLQYSVNKDIVKITSAGADRQYGTSDDITN